mgnify:CR=1 FL=1
MYASHHDQRPVDWCLLTKNARDLTIGTIVSATLRTEPACDGESPRSPNYLVRLKLEDGTMEDIVMPAFHDLHPELEPGARILVGTRVVKDTRTMQRHRIPLRTTNYEIDYANILDISPDVMPHRLW